jgi:hypothetical protein
MYNENLDVDNFIVDKDLDWPQCMVAMLFAWLLNVVIK